MTKTIKSSVFISSNKLSSINAWDTESHFDYFYKKKFFNTKRSYERWLEKNDFFPDIINDVEYLESLSISIKKQLFKKTLNEFEKKKSLILYLQIYKIEKQIILFANDRRGGKKWCLVSSVKSEDILKGLKSIFKRVGKNFLCIPDKNLITSFFSITDKLKSFDLKLSTKHHLHIPMYLFDTPLKLNNVKNNKNKILSSSYLKNLESESIEIIREVVSESEKPVMLYSIGKDSSVMLHLAKKAFYPSKPPFPLMHIDTKWKFKEMYAFRNIISEQMGMKLITYTNLEGIKKDINPLTHGSSVHTDIMKTQGLKQALDKYKFDVAFGGARRDEEKSRAKERIFSFRNKDHLWDPKNQRPEIWNLYNSAINKNESIRVFPLSNWTELDIWQYIYEEKIPIVPLYFSKIRPVVKRDGMLIMVDDDRLNFSLNEKVLLKKIRFRTLGCYPLTGAIESEAESLEDILLELLRSKTSEREGRAIDKDSSSSMEKKKLEGYF